MSFERPAPNRDKSYERGKTEKDPVKKLKRTVVKGFLALGAGVVNLGVERAKEYLLPTTEEQETSGRNQEPTATPDFLERVREKTKNAYKEIEDNEHLIDPDGTLFEDMFDTIILRKPVPIERTPGTWKDDWSNPEDSGPVFRSGKP